MNRVVLVGRLARDPFELRRSASTDTAIISFTLAVDNRSKREENGADFISCVAFNRIAEFIEQYFKKGLLVAVEGRIQTRSYDDRDGKKVFVTEVVCDNVQILESKSARENRQENPYTEQAPAKPKAFSAGIDIDEDELPF